MVTRRGASSLGCLVSLLILVAIVYVLSQIGEPYYRFYSYKDSIQQQARFASLNPDSVIQHELWSSADSLGLPQPAYRLRIVRAPHLVDISTSYDDSWSIGPYTRPVHFNINIVHSQ